MNQSKFSLADVITLLTGLAFGFICFLGANFYTMGDISKSISVATIVAVLLIATAFGAKVLKRATHNFKTFFILEIGLLIIFTGLTFFFSYTIFPHYYVVSEKKELIKNDLNNSLDHAEKLFPEYEKYSNTRQKNYSKKLKSSILTKNIRKTDYADCGFKTNSVSDSMQMTTMINRLKTELIPSHFKLIKSVDSIWLANARKSVNDWKPISLVEVINNLQLDGQTRVNDLVALSNVEIACEPGVLFQYTTPTSKVKNYFTTLGKPTSFTIILAICAYLLMLLSWFITKRDSRSTGASTTASYEVQL